MSLFEFIIEDDEKTDLSTPRITVNLDRRFFFVLYSLMYARSSHFIHQHYREI